MCGPSYDGMASVAEHMGIHCMDLGNLHIKSLARLLDVEINPADGYLSFPDDIRNRMDRMVEDLTECPCELIHQSLSAAIL